MRKSSRLGKHSKKIRQAEINSNQDKHSADNMPRLPFHLCETLKYLVDGMNACR